MICFSCTHERQKQPIIWLYGYGDVEMLNGNVKKLIYQPRIAELPNHLEYTFDEKGNVVTFENIYQGGINTIKYNTIYKNGKKLESVGIKNNLKGEVSREGELYKYDNYGHIVSFALIMYTRNLSDTSTNIHQFRYDKTGYLIEKDEYSDKRLVGINKYRYLYDKNGEMTGLERANSDDWTNFKSFKKDTIQYILIDSKNNWLKAIRFGDTITRKITYY